ncbi:UNVERIFIED_ORG: hypothetical protein E4P37_19160 [Bacillus sp. AZ43]
MTGQLMVGPPAAPDTEREVPAADPGSTRGTRLLLTVLLVGLVLGQRFGFRVGEASVSLTIPLVYAVIVLLAWTGRVRPDRFRVELFLLATAGLLAVTAAIGLSGNFYSPTSLLLLIAIHLPWLLRATETGAVQLAQFGRTFVRIMLVVATVGVLQLGAQFAGVWEYRDVLTEVVGKQWLVQDFNHSNALFYASPIYKANGFVMLEPSFLSQYCALAVIIGVVLRVQAWQLLVLIAGLASSVSGTGILLLLAGALLVLFRAPRLIRPAYIAAAGVGLVLVLLSPVAGLLLERSDEPARPGTSGYQRFVAPYEETLGGLEQEPVRNLVGEGAGSAERVLASDRAGQVGQAVVYTTIPKLVFEYGLLAGGAFALFIVLSMVDRAPWRVVPGTLIIMTFVLSGGLLQAHTAFLTWLFTGFWAREK